MSGTPHEWETRIRALERRPGGLELRDERHAAPAPGARGSRTKGWPPPDPDVQTCRNCGAESVLFEQAQGPPRRCAWGLESRPLVTMPDCPDTCEEWTVLAVHYP